MELSKSCQTKSCRQERDTQTQESNNLHLPNANSINPLGITQENLASWPKTSQTEVSNVHKGSWIAPRIQRLRAKVSVGVAKSRVLLGCSSRPAAKAKSNHGDSGGRANYSQDKTRAILHPSVDD